MSWLSVFFGLGLSWALTAYWCFLKNQCWIFKAAFCRAKTFSLYLLNTICWVRRYSSISSQCICVLNHLSTTLFTGLFLTGLEPRRFADLDVLRFYPFLLLMQELSLPWSWLATCLCLEVETGLFGSWMAETDWLSDLVFLCYGLWIPVPS